MAHGLCGFRMNGENKLTFCHNGMELSVIGTDILKFVKNNNTDDMKRFFDNIVLVKDNQRPTKEEIDDLKKTGVIKKVDDLTWGLLLREDEGNFKNYTNYMRMNAHCYMTDDASMLNNANLIEYAYIINLDTESIDFYKGYLRSDTNSYDMSEDNYRPITKQPYANGYFPCKPVISITFHELKTTLYPKMLGDRIRNAYET